MSRPGGLDQQQLLHSDHLYSHSELDEDGGDLENHRRRLDYNQQQQQPQPAQAARNYPPNFDTVTMNLSDRETAASTFSLVIEAPDDSSLVRG